MGLPRRGELESGVGRAAAAEDGFQGRLGAVDSRVCWPVGVVEEVINLKKPRRHTAVSGLFATRTVPRGRRAETALALPR